MITNLPNKEFRELVPKLRKKGFYKPINQRGTNWKRYNIAQTEEAGVLMREINKIVDTCEVKKIGV